MKQKFTPRAQMARRVLKRTRTLIRPTEAHAMLRANVAHLLARYQRTGNVADLEAYVDWVGEGNLFDDEIDDTPIPDAERPALHKGCARCGRRYPAEEYIEWAVDGEREVALKHFWCADCRAAYGSLRWQDVLMEDAWVTRESHEAEDHDMRRGARRKRAARQED
jgi:hypothetical protein